tara:strand:+ start:576 stop:863 length:288 start_codon:yes stop_codon:yes gene_type:complete
MSETNKSTTKTTREASSQSKHNMKVLQSVLLSEKEKNDTKTFVQTVVKDTGVYDAMDDANKKAADIMEKDGADAAAKYMMNMAGGDYARMRSMYG